MELEKFLRESAALVGLPGYEREIADYAARAFAPYCDWVRTDALSSVAACVGQAGPRVLIAAHLDEIGLMAAKIERDGSLRFAAMGGVDPRILPAAEVKVLSKAGPLYGVIGAKAPHLLSAKEKKRALKIEDLYIDLGLPAETVRAKVRVGDPIALLAKTVALDGDRMAGKTMDDRASLAALLIAAEQLSRRKAAAQLLFVATSQEEVGSYGAQTSAFALKPDVGLAVDVTHGAGPGTGKWEAQPLDKVSLTLGPTAHPALVKLMREVAKNNRVELSTEVCGGETYTDAEALMLARAGAPSLLLSIPLRYMHTTVETLDLEVIREAGRLIALFIEELARGWEDIKWH